MRYRSAVLLASAVLCVFGIFLGVLQAQRPFKQYEAAEYDDFPLPSDWNQKAEWTRARLRYPSVYGQYRRRMDLNWTIDYPRSDRHLLDGIRRLTRIDARSVEQVVDLDGTDDVYNWPMMYAVEVGHWDLPDDQAAQLRQFLLRGGFLMVDDFHGTLQWANFMESMQRVFPDRPVVEISDQHEVFHVLYDLDQRIQIPGIAALARGRTYEQDGVQPHWRGVYDDTGRLVVAINFNMDLGDAWEHADNPSYPEAMTTLAYRFAVNYVVYSMTH